MDYARALAEHPKWRWEPGMGVTTHHGAECVVHWHRDHGGHVATAACDRARVEEWDDSDVAPDINHPATKGWLLHMLREAHGAAFAKDEPWVEHREHGGQSDWLVTASTWPASRMHIANAATEGEALAAALLAVWGQAQTEAPEHTKNCSRITGRLNHDVCTECRKEPA